MEFPAFFQYVYFDNSVMDYTVFALILLLGHLLRGFFTGFISRFFYSVLKSITGIADIGDGVGGLGKV